MRSLAVFFVALIVVTAVYRRVPSNFLRAESGSYLVLSHSAPEVRRSSERELVRYSFNGHYTPLAFLAEFQFARFIGTNGTLWRVRQIIALSAVAAAVFGFGCAVARRLDVARVPALALAAALAGSVAFQLQMVDFISWPFMILQFLWMGCAVLVMYALVRFAVAPSATRWAIIAAATAYGSLHISGLGLILVGATAVAGAAVLWVARRQAAADLRPSTRTIAAALLIMLLLSALHAWAMVALEYAPVTPADAQLSGARAASLAGFLWRLAISGVASFVPVAVVVPQGASLSFLWPLGLLLVAAIVFGGVAFLRGTSRPYEPHKAVRMVLHAFSVAAFGVLFLLIEIRVRGAPLSELANQLANFTWGPRYVIPLHMTLVGSATVLAASVARRFPRTATAVFAALALAGAIAQSEFQRNSGKHLLPLNSISHDAAWRLVLDVVRECRARQLAVPDIPLDALAQEFTGTTLRSVEPLLRHDLKLAADDLLTIVPWSDYTAARHRYSDIRSLKRLEGKLGLRPSRNNN